MILLSLLSTKLETLRSHYHQRTSEHPATTMYGRMMDEIKIDAGGEEVTG
jgi:hypothetical protein